MTAGENRNMTALLIADLHLEESRPDIAQHFFRLLREVAVKAKALYILGDFFNVWIGDDDITTFNQSIIQALRHTANQGTVIYFMPGNRDFLIGKQFLQQAGCILLPDHHVINQLTQPTLLMHGDTLCTQDVKYLKFRKRTRRTLVQKLFLWKSLAKRRAMVLKGREESTDHARNTAPEIMDVTQSEVEKVMREHHVLHLIHGHTHRPAVHQFLLDGQAATRTVLAPWHECGSALVYHADGRQEFIEVR